MVCYHPLIAVDVTLGKQSKKVIQVIGSAEQNPALYVKAQKDEHCYIVPCGQCVGCRLERSRQWAIRISQEASLYENNCFITLTYTDQYCPNSLDLRHFQLFMKRLRKKFGSGIRFFHCGEYGDLNGRPHYHAALLNFDFPDKKLYYTNNGFNYYLSESLSDLWPYGIHLISDLTYDSAGYIARYVLKKLTGDVAVDAYKDKKPPYVTMSRRPGIGYPWIEKYLENVYNLDRVVVKGHDSLPPRYYDEVLKANYPEWLEAIKEQRCSRFADDYNNTLDRLNTREECTQRKIDFFMPRKLDNIL
ncbi:putative VP4 [Microvirus sp.]|nr:putative VP4 [Microvirus sp.]